MTDLAMKLCPKCRRDLPRSSFVRDRTRADGLDGWCRKCRHPDINEYDARKAEARELYASGKKRCSKCGDVKLRGEFNSDRSSTDGLARRCRECARETARVYRQENRERVTEGKRHYLSQHSEELRKWRKNSYDRNADRNREKRRQMYAMWREQVFAYYGTACACCGSLANITIDHVNGDGARHREELRGRRGGGGGAWFYHWLIKQGFPPGYQTLCQPCNRSKGTRERCVLSHDPDGELARDVLRTVRRLERRLMGETLPRDTLLTLEQSLRALESAL